MMKKIKIITKRKSHLFCLLGAINEYKIPPIESWEDEVAETAEKELPIGTAALSGYRRSMGPIGNQRASRPRSSKGPFTEVLLKNN